MPKTVLDRIADSFFRVLTALFLTLCFFVCLMPAVWPHPDEQRYNVHPGCVVPESQQEAEARLDRWEARQR